MRRVQLCGRAWSQRMLSSASLAGESRKPVVLVIGEEQALEAMLLFALQREDSMPAFAGVETKKGSTDH
eukprot:CAMPEP_0196745418 /NCGR_PEP_ID=MMETSP1091-20130531/61487_1 /TAXON_ID=302021 /ORGANISM="Rhodomonas sp., Strain CCMP768" /LENGTH=68 /DNA_ID=CAMNT_0042092165 /DNA_START=8 /DNA_END=212 /DNA_ORIENTATION=+